MLQLKSDGSSTTECMAYWPSKEAGRRVSDQETWRAAIERGTLKNDKTKQILCWYKITGVLITMNYHPFVLIENLIPKSLT